MDFKETLTGIFSDSNVSDEQIEEAINIVSEQQSLLSSEEQLEEMINLLVESGDSTLVVNDEEGATGVSCHVANQEDPEVFRRLLDWMPVDDVYDNMIMTEGDMASRDPLDVWEHLKQMLPNADPIYLRNQARVLVTRPAGELEEFIENAIEKENYPTLQEYLIKKELELDVELYMTKFSVGTYLQNVPNPLETYADPNRKPILSGDVDENDLDFALTFLYNQFPYQRKREIEKIFLHFDKNLVKTCNKLKSVPKAFRHPRKNEQYMDCKNVQLMQEVSFLKHEKIIRQFLKQKDEDYRLALEEATFYGLLQTCGCCYDDQLLPEECYFCKKNCTFCKTCVKAGAENVIGKEETTFPCLDCDSEFDYSTLQMVLDSKTFKGVCHRRQIEEIRNAKIDGLETCPFCDYCMIPDAGDKIFKCANVDCMAETCRLCRHKAHVPLRCNEIEYDEDVKMRTFIENKMTEALLRQCWKCSKRFYKESGCNKMTCSCGAKMCYVCGQAVTDYTHFAPNGRCPLHTENLQEFHLQRVRQGAQAAKDELGVTQNPDSLKFDPTRGLERDVAGHI